MSSLQPEDEPPIQEFLNEFGRRQPQATWRKGRGGAANDMERSYVSYKKLDERLDKSRVRGLLHALFRNWDQAAPDADFIRKHCLRTFAILISIGCGRLIYIFAKYQNLHDQQLPHLTEPQHFPSLTDIHLFTEFYHKQWCFCPQRMVYDMSLSLPRDVILPILDMDILDEEGGSAILHKIQVDEDLNELQPSNDDDVHGPYEFRNVFALKTYRTEDAKKYYDAESEAFKRLRYNEQPHPNIIAFYGSFERGNTYNIILEYADGGNFDDFMKRTARPVFPNDLKTFWTRFFDLFYGLATIHGQGEQEGNEPYVLCGWHQDINPANILIKTKPNASSSYDVHFKIADFGLSHFKKRMSGARQITDKDTFGTRAYGAPETHRPDFQLENSTLRVKQDVDIWSMGCVLSEAVTWVSYGWNKVEDYRCRRLEENDRLTGKREESFHDGEALLQTVTDVHRENVERRHQNDELTEEIINHLISRMLIQSDKDRPAANDLYRKSKKLVSNAFEHITPRRSPNINPQRPQEARQSSFSSTGTLSPELPPSGFSRYSDRASHSSHDYSYFPPTPFRQNPRDVLNSGHPVPPLSTSSNTGHSGQDPNVETPDEHQRWRSPRARELPNGRAPPLPNRRPSNNDLPSLSVQESNMSRTRSRENRRPPSLSVHQGLDLLRRHEEFPYEYLMEQVRTRDHAFVIDNSTSSNEFRTHMREVLELLASKVAHPDQGGFKLYFTAPYKKLTPPSVPIMLEHFDKTTEREITDIRSCLATIFTKYQEKLGKPQFVEKMRRRKLAPFIGPNKLSLYILTDGIWEPNVDLIQEITTLVDHLLDKKLTDKQVGIQFIRFGSDEDAISKLKKLTSGLELRIKIVDSVPADGNVWKMLLGAIHPWFQGNYDDEDAQMSPVQNSDAGLASFSLNQ